MFSGRGANKHKTKLKSMEDNEFKTIAVNVGISNAK